jgi:hypothetical protein
MEPVRFDVKAFISQQAKESGMSEGDALLFAEKCYDGMPPVWQPFGGAESFEDIATAEAANLYQGNVNQLTYQLQAVIGNVMQNDNLSAGEKSAAISKAATDYETKMSELDISKGPQEQGTKALSAGVWGRLKSQLHLGEKRDVSTGERKTLAKKGEALPDGSFPIASVGDLKNAIQAIGRAKNPSQAKAHIKKMARKLDAADQIPEGWKSLDEDEIQDLGQRFKMFTDTEGNLRWLAFSTNAFEDHSREVFSTKAIEDAVEWHNTTGERGPLRIFHVEGADIGNCDFQAVQGRFLIESGTFYDNPMGQKAVQYFEEHPEEEWQISVGYFYKADDDADGTYDWVRWKERSVLPVGMADNPFTGFWTSLDKSGEKAMRDEAKATLVKLVGDDLANGIIARADEGTKSLEEAGIRFKMKDDEFGDITDVEEVTPAAGEEGSKEVKPEPVLMAHEHGGIRHKHRVTPESEHNHTGLTEAYKAAKMTPAELKAAAEDAKDGGKDDADENADGSKKTGKKELDADDPMVKVAEVLAGLVDDVSTIKDVVSEVKELKSGLKALQASEDERMASFMSSRFTFPGGVRPSEISSNLVDGTKEGIKEVITDGTDAPPTNPAQLYVDDLFGKNGAVRIQQG